MNLWVRLFLLQLRMRSGQKMSIWDVARTSFRVAPGDLDVFKHMNNGRYLTIMDLGRWDWMQRSGLWRDLKQWGWYPVVASQTITYRRSLTLGQRFEVYTRLLGYHERWVYVEQTFCVGEAIYAQAVLRCRFLKRKGGTVERQELESITGVPPRALDIAEWVKQWTVDSREINEDFRTAIIS